MTEYRNTDRTGDTVYVERRRGGAGRTLAIIALLAIVIIGLLFATGFFKLNTSGGSLPKVDVSAKSGSLPDVDLDSKKVVVGTKETTVEVPKVKTEKETVSVPVLGVSEGETDKGKK